MLRNDYRRALIMLRSLRQGVSGYVRLERRTLMGTMQFTVNGAGVDEALYALLLSERNGLWQACLLDRLGPPRYGQCGMVYRFDPRNICGNELERYALVAVATQRENDCELLLAGYLNGTVMTDWQQVRQAICAALAPAAAAAPREETAPPAESGGEQPPRVPSISVNEREAFPEARPDLEETQKPGEDVGETAEAEAMGEDGAPPDSPAEAEPAGEEMPRQRSAAPDELDRPAESRQKETEQPAPPDEFDTPARASPGKSLSAGDLLDLDMTRPWPEGIEPLRAIFRDTKASAPFEADGFTLIEAPLAAPGLQRCVIGVSAANGRPARVLYGVPGRFAQQPPAGLEGYEWRGGLEDGYWITVRPVEQART